MTESELLSIEAMVSRMKAELDVGEKCKLLIAHVRYLRKHEPEVVKPTVEQVIAAQNFLSYVQSLQGATSDPVNAATVKAIAIIDAYLTR